MLVVSILQPEAPSIAHTAVSVLYVSLRPVHLLKAVKVLVLDVPHLAYAVMRSILSIHTPIAFLCD
jgi:hypothetical protein